MMKPHKSSQPWWFDLLIPIGSVLVICFALGSVIYNGDFHIPNSRTAEFMKAHKPSPQVALP